MAWAEDPPSRTRHLIANIEVEPGEIRSELEVYSNFIVYRSRVGDRAGFLCRGAAGHPAARRRRAADRSRKMILDQNVLMAKNVSIFF